MAVVDGIVELPAADCSFTTATGSPCWSDCEGCKSLFSASSHGEAQAGSSSPPEHAGVVATNNAAQAVSPVAVVGASMAAAQAAAVGAPVVACVLKPQGGNKIKLQPSRSQACTPLVASNTSAQNTSSQIMQDTAQQMSELQIKPAPKQPAATLTKELASVPSCTEHDTPKCGTKRQYESAGRSAENAAEEARKAKPQRTQLQEAPLAIAPSAAAQVCQSSVSDTTPFEVPPMEVQQLDGAAPAACISGRRTSLTRAAKTMAIRALTAEPEAPMLCHAAVEHGFSRVAQAAINKAADSLPRKPGWYIALEGGKVKQLKTKDVAAINKLLGGERVLRHKLELQELTDGCHPAVRASYDFALLLAKEPDVEYGLFAAAQIVEHEWLGQYDGVALEVDEYGLMMSDAVDPAGICELAVRHSADLNVGKATLVAIGHPSPDVPATWLNYMNDCEPFRETFEFTSALAQVLKELRQTLHAVNAEMRVAAILASDDSSAAADANGCQRGQSRGGARQHAAIEYFAVPEDTRDHGVNKCRCHVYNSSRRRKNVEIVTVLQVLPDGKLVPWSMVRATKSIRAGEELLTEYGLGSYWELIHAELVRIGHWRLRQSDDILARFQLLRKRVELAALQRVVQQAKNGVASSRDKARNHTACCANATGTAALPVAAAAAATTDDVSRFTSDNDNHINDDNDSEGEQHKKRSRDVEGAVEHEIEMREDEEQAASDEDGSDGDAGEYEVESIMRWRWQRDEDGVKKRQYFVKWLGYPKSHNTWEWESHFTNCGEILSAYKARNKIL